MPPQNPRRPNDDDGVEQLTRSGGNGCDEPPVELAEGRPRH
jgi:hypothetical protein